MKLAVIGGGSTYTPELVDGLVRMRDLLPLEELALHDVDEARLAVLTGFLLASGASDGHVAFVPPGSPPDGTTAVLALAETTRRDNLATFPEFESLDEVPTHGVSVGLGTIAAARALRLVLHGDDKRAATARLLALDGFHSDWPASIVHEHADAEIWLDKAALP